MVAEEDGVEISLIDSDPSNMEEENENYVGSLNKDTDIPEKAIDAVSSEIVSFSFEAQVRKQSHYFSHFLQKVTLLPVHTGNLYFFLVC